MTETFAALLFAHVLADFVFQTGWMAQGKQTCTPGPMALHIAIVAAAAALVLGTVAWPVAVLTAMHLAIDIAKSFTPQRRLWPFLADQAAHVASLILIAFWVPDLWTGGLWAAGFWAGTVGPEVLWLLDVLPALMALMAGAILTTRAGGFAIGLLMAPWAEAALPEGLPNGGKLIGLLERGLIFLLVLVGQPAGIGFLIAAKSVLRFETASKDQKAGEYVIVGTLASFGWALAITYATVSLMAELPPVGLPLPTP